MRNFIPVPGEKARELFDRYRRLGVLEDAIEERRATIKDEHERRTVDKLIARAFNPECGWD